MGLNAKVDIKYGKVLGYLIFWDGSGLFCEKTISYRMNLLLKISSRNESTDGQTTERHDRRMDRHMNNLRETIIPHHYHVAGYKNALK